MTEPGNPKIWDLTKSHRERSYSLGNLKAVTKDGKRYCAWCAKTELRPRQKYCGADCSLAAMVFAYPQAVDSVGELLVRQGYKCSLCQFDYGAIVEQMLSVKRPYGTSKVNLKTFRSTFQYRLTKALKQHCNELFPEKRIEVDHIVPIAKGGSPLDRANLRAVCAECHKAKTKIDNSGPRRPQPPKLTKEQMQEKIEHLSEENDALKEVNQILSAHLDLLMAEKG